MLSFLHAFYLLKCHVAATHTNAHARTRGTPYLHHRMGVGAGEEGESGCVRISHKSVFFFLVWFDVQGRMLRQLQEHNVDAKKKSKARRRRK